MNTLKRLLRNTFFLSVAQIVNPILSMGLVLVLSRKLGPEGLGIYTTVLTLFIFFNLFSALGLNPYLVREISADRSKSLKLFSNAFVLGLFSSLVFWILMFITAKLLNYATLLLNASILMGFALFFKSISTYAQSTLQAYEKMEYCAIILISETLLRVFGGIFVVVSGYGIFYVIVVVVISHIFSMLLGLFYVHKKLFHLRIQFDFSLIRPMMKDIPSFLSLSLIVMIYWDIDILMLSKMKGVEDVGFYSAAYRFLTIGKGLANCYIAAIFPVISRYYVKSKDHFKMGCVKSIKYLFLSILPIAVVITYLSQDILTLFYGNAFIVSTRTLQVLIWTLLFFPIANVLGNGLIASHQQKIDLVVNTISATFNVMMNIILIPRFGYFGAGLATLLSILFFLFLQQYYVRRLLFRMNFIKIITKPVMAALCMIAFMYLFRNGNHLMISLLGMMVYVLCLYAFKTFQRDEIVILKNALRLDPITKENSYS